ncbi:methylated-DNA--protein-cysteine methyltransferase-like [Corticium candelabrum]|uniref:methylated-DNA--protein-cysteine methyltransferase-like n=1 Tax=Corticium candelabrum TaxID=121492 RepID=UPI002E2766A4|nr:methylated-DNA--protein-cysteine methyltransferase-like [Corticium candelabrum]XP_062516514.1 methylated-DNA--protein-cysteine methyltransferase-like [Corticium candelabrum]
MASASDMHVEQNVAYYLSPVGLIKIQASAKGITSLKIVKDKSHAHSLIEEHRLETLHNCTNPSHNKKLDEALKWLEEYFCRPEELRKDGCRRLPPLDLPMGGNFVRKVWLTLADHVPLGRTTTYGELAQLAGRPAASRAAGQAMRTNPVSIIVPCHRVLPKSGGVGRYSGGEGSVTKQWLLDHERVCGDMKHAK